MGKLEQNLQYKKLQKGKENRQCSARPGPKSPCLLSSRLLKRFRTKKSFESSKKLHRSAGSTIVTTIVTSDNTVTGLESGHTAVKDVDPKQDHFLNFV